ncbi:MAG TPA: hypothetical protein VHE83_18320 [Mycobacteriales bacterium]|nr:hypothetical protein [Mycobacteriales bacterium]
MTVTFPPPDDPDELLALFLGDAYDLFDDELLGDGTWDGHVLHVARTFTTPELRQIRLRLLLLSERPVPNTDLEHHLVDVLGVTLGPLQADLRAGLRHTAMLVATVLREREETR